MVEKKHKSVIARYLTSYIVSPDKFSLICIFFLTPAPLPSNDSATWRQ